MTAYPKSLLLPIALLLSPLFAAGGSAPGAEHTPPQSDQGYLGIGYQVLTQEIVRESQVPAKAGVLITDVHAPGPAAAAGVAKGDVFIEFDGKEIADENSFRTAILQVRPGNRITVKFVRAGKTEATTITAGTAPPAIAYFRRGAERDRNGDQPGAIADYSEVIRLEPRNMDAYLARGWAKAKSGDRSGAIADYSEAIHLNPQNAQVYLNRGIAKADSGDHSGAIADYSEVIRLNPKSVYAYFDRALAKANNADFAGAIADYSMAISLDPKNADAFLNRGLATANGARPTGGKKLSRKESAAAQKRTADAMADFMEANRLYTEAIRLDPNNPLAHEYRATARDQIGDKEGATHDRAAAANIREQIAFAKFRREVTAAALSDLFVSSDRTETQARERNRAIVAAKIRQLPAILRETKTEELSSLLVKIEQTILDLNHESEVAKDRAQQAMANNGPAGQIDELRGLTISYRERIELLKPILIAIKEEIVNRNR